MDRTQMNKYEKALNSLNELVASTNSLGKCWDIELLEELIDNYEKLEQELECIYDNPKQELEECITDLDIKNQKLEKALDKACEKLRHSGYCDTLWECENNDISLKYKSCEECIKDHLLKEGDKNELSRSIRYSKQ